MELTSWRAWSSRQAWRASWSFKDRLRGQGSLTSVILDRSTAEPREWRKGSRGRPSRDLIKEATAAKKSAGGDVSRACLMARGRSAPASSFSCSHRPTASIAWPDWTGSTHESTAPHPACYHRPRLVLAGEQGHDPPSSSSGWAFQLSLRVADGGQPAVRIPLVRPVPSEVATESSVQHGQALHVAVVAGGQAPSRHVVCGAQKSGWL